MSTALTYTFRIGGKRSRPDSTRKQAQRRTLARRDGPGCYWCGDPAGDTLDHVVPQSWGGDWKITNLVLACDECQHLRARHTSSAHAMGGNAAPTYAMERLLNPAP